MKVDLLKSMFYSLLLLSEMESDNLCNKALRSYICLYIYTYILALAGQTAEPIWLTFFYGTHGYPGGNKGEKSPRATPGNATKKYIDVLRIL